MQRAPFRRFGGYLRTKWASPRRLRFWLLVLVVLYTLLGFFALPWIIQSVAVSTVQEDFGRELRIESVQTNPYMLTLRIDGVELDDTDNRQLLGWNRLFIDLAWSSLVNRTWIFQTIRLNKPVVQEERFASGETRLTRLAPESSDKAPADDKAPGEDEPDSLPALRINDLQIENGVLRFADNLQDPAAADKPEQVSLALQDVRLSVTDFTLQKDTHFPLRLAGQLAGGGKLAFDGTLQLLPSPALEGGARIDELALLQAEPYLRQFANVRLGSGNLNLSGQIHTDARQPFAFQGSAGIDALSISEGPDDESLIGWQSLQIDELDMRLKERQLETATITVDGLSGRIVIHEDQTTNFGQLVAKPPDDPEDNDGAEQTKDTDEEATPFGVTIESIELTDGALRFADYSLPLPFSTSIHTLSGQISTLSSTSAEPARVKLEGQVAEFGLAHVEGAVHAWHPTRQTNLHLRFRNLRIPEYSPYTVDFAGRKIAGGTMDLDLDYTVKDRQLEGQNNLVLHDLKLGEKMASSDAMDLPLDLAIALLQDSDGVIDLTLPVTGNVGDPEFDFDKVIREALGNAITSVIKAPFSFLAGLVGADSEDLGQVEFTQGGTDLLPPQRERIAKLREALNQRPALALELAGPYSQAFDGPALQHEKAIETLRQRLAEADREVADPSLTVEPNQDIVETMFTTYYPDIDLEAVQARFTDKQTGSSDETDIDALAYRNHLAERVIAAQPVTDAELEAIADARASAVRDALVKPDADTGIASDRVRLLDPEEIDSVEGERIAMEVGLTAD
ncbi:DUF748 domain-containing protein [Marinobacter orientalis]|uniref:DUF748 domain-containing protein n=1 Tax=Marinobacter orientalis TaxID=1928859 RepID=A0A7Y0REX1_9GAMM|nr:DUF748 domain-containing protein [Marinobacter orientalis]NMT64967.1 DUF748 domain-containing protein [Marinobacter orientalis]TGX48140.1 DUF748 domain-containing protein [Marinobacter orientalis]